MQSFFQWFEEQRVEPQQPWLILGKGPTFAKRREFDLGGYKTVALNHVIREQQVDLAHLIDLDVLHDCAAEIEHNARALVMPWVPHVNCAVGTASLADLVEKVPVLKRMSASGRLLWYNFGSASTVNGDSPVVPIGWFSAEAALNLLAIAGARRVRSLGVDGGTNYSKEFDDLKDKTLLANGHESFDRQFAKIADLIARTGIEYGPLDVETPIRVFVGGMEEHMLSFAVLEHSIRKRASISTEIVPLWRAPAEVRMPRDPKNRPRTPFSFQRFLIPALAGYAGRAIYVDSDMQVMTDIRGLWAYPFNGAEVLAAAADGESGRSSQFSVMLLDCKALRWNIGAITDALDGGTLTYERLMFELAIAKNVRSDIDHVWNSLEHYEPGKTALLHYTDMPTQPWVSSSNPLGYLWVRELFEAIGHGFITIDYVREHVARGWVRPSLLFQIEHQIADSLALPDEAKRLDDSFVPPFKRMQMGTGSRRAATGDATPTVTKARRVFSALARRRHDN